MRMKKLEEHYNRTMAVNEVNDIILDYTLDRVEKTDDKEMRAKEVELIKTGLETRENCHKVELEYVERKAERRGYFTALVGSVIGMMIGEFAGPKIVGLIKKK